MHRVAIVIVTYNSASEIGNCLEALKALADTEVVVVDNASQDVTVAEIKEREVRLIVNTHNAGFAGAVNQGVRATTAPFVLLLNPDAVFIDGLDALVNEFQDPQTGAAGGMLLGSSGLPQAGFMARNLPRPAALILEVLGINALWPHNSVNWQYRCLGLDPVTPALVEQPAGAFLMFPRKVWAQLGGFDEGFWPVWFEDVDFCARVKQAGLSIRYNPAAVAKHEGAHSVGTLPLAIRQRYWYGSLLKYAAKHYPPLTYRMVCGAVAVGAAFRAFAAACSAAGGWQRNGFKAVVAYGAVCRLALGRLVTGRTRCQ